MVRQISAPSALVGHFTRKNNLNHYRETPSDVTQLHCTTALCGKILQEILDSGEGWTLREETNFAHWKKAFFITCQECRERLAEERNYDNSD